MKNVIIKLKIQSLSDYFINISSKTDAQIRELISSEKIDILIDLSGLTYLNRLTLFAQKLLLFKYHLWDMHLQ